MSASRPMTIGRSHSTWVPMSTSAPCSTSSIAKRLATDWNCAESVSARMVFAGRRWRGRFGIAGGSGYHNLGYRRRVELEEDLRLLLRLGIDAARTQLGDARLARARRAAGYLARHHEELRERGLLALGERPADVHLAPALEGALSPQA